MARVLILQNMSLDGPAYLGSWLQAHGVAAEVRNTEAGASFPQSLAGFDGLAMLGGAMSANDALPSLRQAERLFLEALDAGVPTLGHCLGGQLMSRALGMAVGPSPRPEVGWHEVQFVGDSQRWFGAVQQATLMQWHYEAFGVPQQAGATCIATSAACPHQAWTLGPHLAMQFHIEVDAAKLEAWCCDHDAAGERGLRRGEPTPAHIRADSLRHLAAHQRLADRVYAHWLGHFG